MKKLTVIICCISLIFMCGCGRKTGENFTETERFTIVFGDNMNAPYYETIFADEETGVMYLALYKDSQFGITPLLNEDGTPMLVKDGTGG